MFKRKEVRIALIFIAGIALVYWGINFLKGKNIFSNQTILYAEYTDIAGLQEANPIMLNGFKIGQVSTIEFKDGGVNTLIVKLLIDEDVHIPSNSIARIVSSDLLGSKAIVIIPGDSRSIVESGDYLIGEIETSLKDEVSMQILPLKNKAEDLISSFDSVLVILQTIFNENTRENLRGSFESISNTIRSLEHASYNIDTLLSGQRNRLANIFANVESITVNLKNNNQQISNILTNMSDISDTLAAANLKGTIQTVNKSMTEFNAIMARINNGDGSLGLLVNNDSLYNNLEQSANKLDLLLDDIRLNPRRYIHFSVFGGGKKKNTYVPR